jgi:large subunit ribosomal protein L6
VNIVRVLHASSSIQIPGDVKVKVLGKKVEVEGPLGKVEKDFSHAKRIFIRLEDKNVIVETHGATKKDYALVNTIASHINNMVIGVTKGYRYKMKIVYAHFPMNLKIVNDKVIIENFLGGRGKRSAKIMPGVRVKIEKEDVIVEGIDKDAVAQTAANIHLATHLRGKRALSPHGREGTGPGILDGIYLYAIEYLK